MAVQCGSQDGQREGPHRQRQQPRLPGQPRRDRAQRRQQRHGLGRREREAGPDRQLGGVHARRRRTTRTRTRTRTRATADRRPPQAKPDAYGVRAGRTTVLHPLDNDSAPEGRLLSIVDVDQPTGGARVEISPDGQTLVLQMPDGRPPGDLRLLHRRRPQRPVGARPRSAVECAPTRQTRRPSCARATAKPTYSVPHDGALAVPVLADWRDDRDGDTLLLDSAQAVGGEESGASARGHRRRPDPLHRADRRRRGRSTVRVEFAVTDGRSAPVRKSMSFDGPGPLRPEHLPRRAPSPTSSAARSASRSRSGRCSTTSPARTPPTPDAELALGGKVPQQPGAKVVSDLDSGQLTFTGERAGTYFLSYDAGYGNARSTRAPSGST